MNYNNTEEMRGATISSVLAEALKKKDFTIERLAEETRVSERFITLLIEEQLDSLPPAPYIYGYITKLADALDLNGEELWERFFKHNKTIRTSGKHDTFPPNRFTTTSINKALIIIGVLIVAVVAYLLIRTFLSFDISRELSLEGFPPENAVVQEAVLTIKGNVGLEYELTINQIRIYPEETGNFSHNIELREGFNTIVFTVTGLLGKSDQVVRQVFYKPLTETNSIETPINQPAESSPALPEQNDSQETQQ